MAELEGAPSSLQFGKVFHQRLRRFVGCRAISDVTAVVLRVATLLLCSVHWSSPGGS